MPGSSSGKWNAWLGREYLKTENLQAAWAVGAEPLGAEPIVGGAPGSPQGAPIRVAGGIAPRAAKMAASD